MPEIKEKSCSGHWSHCGVDKDLGPICEKGMRVMVPLSSSFGKFFDMDFRFHKRRRKRFVGGGNLSIPPLWEDILFRRLKKS